MDLSINTNKIYRDVFNAIVQNTMPKTRFIVLQGSRGSGKSYVVAQSLILRALTSNKTNILVFRKFATTNRKSTFLLLKSILNELQIKARINSIEQVITFNNGSTISCMGFDYDPTKLKSLTDISTIWIEEALEVSYQDFLQANAILRMKNKDLKLIISYNPDNISSWIYEKFWTKDDKDTYKLITTFEDNVFIDKETYKQTLLDTLGSDEETIKSWIKGEWSSPTGRIFTHFKVQDFNIQDLKDGFFILGSDFGWTSPSTLVLSYITDDTIYTIDSEEHTHIINIELINFAKEMLIRNDVDIENCYFVGDSAEPDRIQEFSNYGFITYLSKKETKNNISRLKRLNWIIKPQCKSLIKEITSWCWATDRDGKSLNVPMIGGDHCIDAVLYSISMMDNFITSSIAFI